MSAPIEGFIAALVMAAIVMIWITICMFCRERHKPEYHQYDISDLRQKNVEIAQAQEASENMSEKKGIAAGIFILPSRHKQKDDYESRPDYPESPVPHLQPHGDNLVDLFNDSTADIHYKDGIYEIDSCAQYQSDV